MKQLIPQLKIDEAAKEYADNYTSMLAPYMTLSSQSLDKSFNSGVQFALNEIQPLMVEFAEWVAKNRHDWIETTSVDTNINCYPKTTQQLLEEFIQQKTMKELEKLLEFKSEEERQEFINDKNEING